MIRNHTNGMNAEHARLALRLRGSESMLVLPSLIRVMMLTNRHQGVELLRKILASDVETLALFELAIARGPGGENNPHGCKGKPEEESLGDDTEEQRINVLNTNIDSTSKPTNSLSKKPRGGSDTVSYAIRRLSRERPDLLERVKAGELSAHGAMVEAGFRKVPTLLDLVRGKWDRASPADRQALRDWILSQCEQ